MYSGAEPSAPAVSDVLPARLSMRPKRVALVLSSAAWIASSGALKRLDGFATSSPWPAGVVRLDLSSRHDGVVVGLTRGIHRDLHAASLRRALRAEARGVLRLVHLGIGAAVREVVRQKSSPPLAVRRNAGGPAVRSRAAGGARVTRASLARDGCGRESRRLAIARRGVTASRVREVSPVRQMRSCPLSSLAAEMLAGSL